MIYHLEETHLRQPNRGLLPKMLKGLQSAFLPEDRAPDKNPLLLVNLSIAPKVQSMPALCPGQTRF
jgi:hypothetical protein